MPINIKNNTHCESCMMPFVNDTGIRESEKYCSLCFTNGKFSYEGNSLKEFQDICYRNMVSGGMNKFKAKVFTFMIRFAPRWKNQK